MGTSPLPNVYVVTMDGYPMAAYLDETFAEKYVEVEEKIQEELLDTAHKIWNITPVELV